MCTALCNTRNMLFKLLRIIHTRVNVAILNVTVYISVIF